MNPVVHFEIPTTKLPRAQEFYKKTFGWNMEDIPEMEYVAVRTTEVDEKRMPKQVGTINGGMMAKNPHIKTPVVTINVDDIDESMKNIVDNGGTIIVKKQEVKDMGFSAYFKDTEGNIMGLWENAQKM